MSAPTLLFVVLPNGRTASGHLRLSVYLTPRLAADGRLADTPDLLNWPALVADKGLRLDITLGGVTATVTVPVTQLRPDLWKAVFKADSPVAAYPRPPKTQPVVISYPVLQTHAFVRGAYRTAAARPAALAPKGETSDREGTLLGDILGSLAFRDDGESTLDAAISAGRIALWNEQLSASDSDRIDRLPAGDTPMAGAPVRDLAQRFSMFHRPPPAPGAAPLPKTSADFEKTIDFHQALASIAAYPALLRAMGLVFDVDLPGSGIAVSPDATGGFGEVSVTKVTPGWAWSATPSFSLPATAYVLDSAHFDMAPATPTANIAAGQRLPGDVDDGFLTLSPDLYGLIGVDIDGAMMKAMTLADNVAAVTDPRTVEQVLPALRSGGISLIANGRAQDLLRALSDQAAFHQAEDGIGAFHRPFNARDLVRGYRLDVWSSLDKTWRSLHRRDGVYRFGADGALVLSTQDEEGFTQLAATQPPADPTRPEDPASKAAGAPQPGDDIFLHERVARWHGWSLSAPRPGRPLNRSADPTLATEDDPTAGQAITPFKMTTTFSARPGSLPRLRFGARYRVRVRVVDLAGNSRPLGHAEPKDSAAPPTTVAYHRFEPVSSPVVALRNPPGPGGSQLHMVIRSFNSAPDLDGAPSTETDERHLFPPKADVLTVEHHGMLDDASGKFRADKATYDLVVERDKGVLPTQDQTPMEPAAQGVCPYFPDPIARGIAIRGLPGAPANAVGIEDGGKLTYRPRPPLEPTSPSVTQIGFGDPWPERRPARLLLRDGSGAPAWDAGGRVLSVSLPKGSVVDVNVSCFLNPADLEVMGVWDWVRTGFEAGEAEAMASFSFGGDNVPGSRVVTTTEAQALLTRLTLEGGHEMITPPETVTLVHATQQPLGRPSWIALPINRTVPAPAKADVYAPITAWRSVGSHDAVLFGALRIHGASSARIDLDGVWTDVLDDPAKPGPTTQPGASHVATLELRTLEAGLVPADASKTAYVADYLQPFDILWFARPSDQLQGVDSPSQLAAPVHHLGDTRRRRIRYRAVAASRFAEYFSDKSLDFTRKSDVLEVDVPSSSRPSAPNIHCVLPTFGWQRQESTNIRTETRQGNALRVYLNRPWYSSGEGEQLGVVIWPEGPSPPDDAAREKYRAFFTQWGLDPLWAGGGLYDTPRDISFPLAVNSGGGLTLENTDLTVDVMGHAVEYDADRQLWFCDIAFNYIFAYAPFVRLALARYQPGSVSGTELSHVVLADVAQLTPDRSAALTVDPAEPRAGRLFIAGRGPSLPNASFFSVSVEQFDPKIGGDLAWGVAPVAAVAVLPDSPAPSDPDSVLWAGSILFTEAPSPGVYRVVVREYEVHPVDPVPGDIVQSGLFGERLVYASILNWTF